VRGTVWHVRVAICLRPSRSLEAVASGKSRAECLREARRLLTACDALHLMEKAYGGTLNANPLLGTRRSRISGRGVFARRVIRAGAKVEDVTRPLVPYSQIPQKGDAGYGHAVQISRGHWLLLTHSQMYYLNHSCAANTGLEIEGATVKVVATRNIRSDEELSLDYATLAFRDDPYSFPCACGAPRCRGVVKGERR
jgi:hypothetical protein